ncbi:enolase-binding protein-like [Phlebotomus argentipes]|uniref:enolase-binding protein-like n=1 Tax=Phlebotomus argentipes TaxID=94469 RepID=UPI0028929AD9|nr:enolase-binding protein-like [Phlebotomus argentipes]
MKSVLVLLTLLPVIFADDFCLLKASFEINNRVSTECKVPANLTTPADVEILKVLCTTDEEAPAEVQILTAKQTEFGNRDICTEGGTKTPGLFTWIAWKDFHFTLRPLINQLSEANVFVGRDITGNICRLNITSASCLNSEKSEEAAVDVKEVLLERLPVAYELTNIVYDRWRNVTFLNQTVLTSVNLTNAQHKTDFVEALVRFDFEKKINITLLEGLAAGVPIILHEDQGTLRYTVGEVTKKMQSGIVSVVKRLPASTSAMVRVVGTETLSVIHMSAKLTTIYARDDQGVDKIEEGDVQTSCIETGVMDVRPEETVSIHIDTPGSGGGPKAPHEITKSPTLPPIYIPPSTENPPISLFQNPGPIYPGFKTFSTIGAILFFSVFIIAMTDVARKIIQAQRQKDRKLRRDY